MTYRIEITADTMSELGGKLLAMASQFHTAAPSDPVMPEIRDAAPAKPKAAKAKKEEAGNAPPASTVEAPSATLSSEPDTPTVESAPAPSEPDAPVLDFDKDVTPLVLRVAKEKGKDVAIEILSQFGAARASEVDEARWPELCNALSDAL
ncbi:MAG: hypothetical protein RLZZ387_2586 [Chloroflexota bacterium]|jgi:hypothetical protein